MAEYKIPVQPFTAKNIRPEIGMVVLLDDSKGKTIAAKVVNVGKDSVMVVSGA